MKRMHIKRLPWKHVMASICWMVLFCCVMVGGKTWAAVEDYAGIYSGNYQGDNEGIWTAEFQRDGALQMIVWSKTFFSGFSSAGTVDMNGVFFAVNTDQGFSANGEIDSQSGVTGIWNWAGMQGDFDGRKSGVTEYEEYVGTYSGTYSGDYTGTVKVCIEENGRLSGSAHNTEYDVTERLSGNFVNNTEILAYSDQSTAFYAVLESGVTLTGRWYRADDGTSGDFVLGKTSQNLECDSNDNNDGGSGGGGGGCFIAGASLDKSKANAIDLCLIGLLAILSRGSIMIVNYRKPSRRR